MSNPNAKLIAKLIAQDSGSNPFQTDTIFHTVQCSKVRIVYCINGGVIAIVYHGSIRELKPVFVCLFDLILYVPSTIFQLYRDGSSWVEPVLS